MQNGQRPPRQTMGLITLAFLAVGIGALAITLVAMGQSRRLMTGAREVAASSLTSVRLLGHLDADLQKRRILVDDHIFAKAPSEMKELDAQILAIDEEIRATSRMYDRWTNWPQEREIWARTQSDLAALDAPTARVLALSRQNRDVEAREVMSQVSVEWAQVGEDLEALIALNDRGAADSLARMSVIGRHLNELLLGLGLAGLLATLAAGRWASRQVARREAKVATHTQGLEARNRELDAFAGRVAHDVRGPLTTLKLAMPALGAKLPKDDRTLELLGRGIGRMESLVEDLLTLARVESQATGNCDPAAVVAEVEADFAPRIAAENGALRVAVHHADVSCSGGLLRQAVTNLVENAVKYHRPEAAPEVEISGAPSDGSYDLRVTDNGVGMSAEEAEHVAQPFYRSPRTQDRPGTGLGLSIVRRVAEASGGKLSVQSWLGRGSTFVVRLPLAKMIPPRG
ncbi:MAG TPA: ATP-binding protein [Polyangia bacterium]|nr:ATP-binding protein [Polyangia bacterium]